MMRGLVKRTANIPLSSTEELSTVDMKNFVEDMSQCIIDEAHTVKPKRNKKNGISGTKPKQTSPIIGRRTTKSQASSTLFVKKGPVTMSGSLATGTVTTSTRSSSHVTPKISNISSSNILSELKGSGKATSYDKAFNNQSFRDIQEVIEDDDVSWKLKQSKDQRQFHPNPDEARQISENEEDNLYDPSRSESSSFEALTDISSLTFHSHRSVSRRHRQRQMEKINASYDSKRSNALADTLVDEEREDSYSSHDSDGHDRATLNLSNGLQCGRGLTDSNQAMTSLFQSCFPVLSSQHYEDSEVDDIQNIDYRYDCNQLSRESPDKSSLDQVGFDELNIADEMTTSLQSIKVSSEELMIDPSDMQYSTLRHNSLTKNRDDRISLLVWPKTKTNINGVRGMSSNILILERLSDDLGLFLSERRDGVAQVKKVKKFSLTYEAGVMKGDIVQFALALTKLEKENDNRCKLAKKIAIKLESIGMRTSYSELFELFLAETTASWPIAIVFSRPRRAQSIRNNWLLFKNTASTMLDDCCQAENFLRHLSRKYRDAICVTNEIIRGDIENFMRKPTSFEDKSDKLPLGIDCTNKIYVKDVREKFSADHTIERKKLFCQMIEDSRGIVFIRSTKTGFGLTMSIGHGIVLTRINKGWSSPCTIGYFGLGGGVQIGCEQNDFLFLIYDDDIINKFRQGKQFVLGGNLSFAGFGQGREYCGLSQFGSFDQTNYNQEHNRASFTAFARNNSGVLVGASIEGISVSPINILNRSVYGSMSTSDILSGYSMPFDEVSELHSAIKCAECPYSLSAHPIVPYFLKNYVRSIWSIDYSSPLSKPHVLEPSVSGVPDRSEFSINLRELLLSISIKDQIMSLPRNNELNNFIEKFKRFLREGVPVMYLVDRTSQFEKRYLYLIVSPNNKISDSKLRFFDKTFLTRGNKVKKTSTELYSLNPNDYNEYLIVGRIVKMSQQVPPSVSVRGNMKSRFISLESDTGLKQYFYTCTDSDVELLLSGLKVIFEKGDD